MRIDVLKDLLYNEFNNIYEEEIEITDDNNIIKKIKESDLWIKLINLYYSISYILYKNNVDYNKFKLYIANQEIDKDDKYKINNKISLLNDIFNSIKDKYQINYTINDIDFLNEYDNNNNLKKEKVYTINITEEIIKEYDILSYEKYINNNKISFNNTINPDLYNIYIEIKESLVNNVDTIKDKILSISNDLKNIRDTIRNLKLDIDNVNLSKEDCKELVKLLLDI